MSIRIVLADDHTLFRQGLRSLLENEPDLEVVAEAENGQVAIDQVLRHCPDVVLMDIAMPVLDGLSATRRLHDACPQVHIIVVSGAEEASVVVSAVRAGAIGYLCKTARFDDLVQTIRAAAQGQVTFSAAAAARFVQELHAPSEQPEHLTDRELEVMACVADGMSNKAIAWKLDISEKTVKSHVSTILGKFGLESRTQAALHATRLGLVPSGRTLARIQPRPLRGNIESLESRRRAPHPFAARSA